MQDKTLRLVAASRCNVRGLPRLMALVPLRSWVLLFFLGQVAGSLGVLWLLKLNVREMAVPLGILLAGAVVSPALFRNEQDQISSSWPRWVPALLYACFIFSLSHRSFSGVTVSFSTDLFHPMEFGALGLLLCFAWHPVLGGGSFRSFAGRVIATGMAFAVSDEIHQAFVPGRSPTLVDLALDLLGLSLAVGAFRLVSHVRKIGRGAP